MITTPYFKQLQAAHQYQGKTNNCGPYCAAITAKALGFEQAKGIEFTNSLNPIRWKGILPIFQRIPSSATMPWGTTHLLNILQLRTRWRPFATERDLLESLQESIMQIIVIGEWRPTWAHYMVFAAYDALLGYGFIDPANKSAELHWYAPAEFIKLWSKYGRILIMVFPQT